MLRALPFVALIACGRFGFGDEHQAPHGDGGSDVAGDGGVPAYAPYWTSGTRLRARLWQPVDGGDPYFAYWRDTMLDTDCNSSVAADGAEHCLPLHHRADQYYADATCTTRLTWSHFGPCGHDSYAYYPDSLGQAHELPIGAQYTGPVYEMSSTCIPTTAPSPGALYSLGAEVPASTFIKTAIRTARSAASCTRSGNGPTAPSTTTTYSRQVRGRARRTAAWPRARPSVCRRAIRRSCRCTPMPGARSVRSCGAAAAFRRLPTASSSS